MSELYARAGERVYGTRTVMRNGHPKVEDFHVATVRHDLFLGELPDFPACLGDWQQMDPPVARHFIAEPIYGTGADGEQEIVGTKTNIIDLAQHGGGEAPLFGVPWNNESWWRPHEHEVGGDRASLHYDLRFRSPSGTCTWRMNELNGGTGGD